MLYPFTHDPDDVKIGKAVLPAASPSSKEKEDLHHTEQAKVENETALKKEKHELERKLGQLDREDQLRMAHRLGDEQLKGHLSDCCKNKKEEGSFARVSAQFVVVLLFL